MLEPIRVIIIKSVSPHFLMLMRKQLMFSMGRSFPLFHLDQSLVHCLDQKGQHLRQHDDHQFSWTSLIQMLRVLPLSVMEKIWMDLLQCLP